MNEKLDCEIELNISVLLKQIMLERIKKNAKYSLRAFARDLGMSPGFLSQILAQKRKLSLEMAMVIKDRNSLNVIQMDLLQKLVELEHSETQEKKEELLQQINSSVTKKIRKKILNLKHFNLISEWYYFPIIELTRTKNPPRSFSEIARRLNINFIDAVNATETLLSLGYIKKDGRYFTPGLVNYTFKVPSSSLRHCHKQFMSLATLSIDNQDIANRIISSKTMAFAKKDLPKVNAIMSKCFSEIASLSAPSQYDAVYQATMQFFQLDFEDIAVH